jgi:hypothetical protein
LEILEEILSYGIGGLYARHGRGYNVFVHEPFFEFLFKNLKAICLVTPS